MELPDLRSEFDGYARLTVPDARILYLRQGQEQVATAEGLPDRVSTLAGRSPERSGAAERSDVAPTGG